MKLYTRTGDTGDTSLFGGDRVPKTHPRLEAYGTLDELNSLLGVLRLHVSPVAAPEATVQRIQGDLFGLCALLATPPHRRAALDSRMRRPDWAVEAIEADIDRLTDLAPPLGGFVLPGGMPGAAWAHLARTVCRRAERLVVALHAQEPQDELVLRYLNRLSDWLFALARAENALAGRPDTAWRP